MSAFRLRFTFATQAHEDPTIGAERRKRIAQQIADDDRRFAEKQIPEFFVFRTSKEFDEARIALSEERWPPCMEAVVRDKLRDLGRANYTASPYTKKTEMCREMADLREERCAHKQQSYPDGGRNGECIACQEIEDQYYQYYQDDY